MATLPARSSVLVGELVDDGSLAELAAGVAADQATDLTRRTYASVYRAYCAFVGPGRRARHSHARDGARLPRRARAHRGSDHKSAESNSWR